MEPLDVGSLLPAGKAHVHLALAKPAVDLLHLAHLEMDADIRIVAAELLHHLRQPVDGHAGVGGDPDALLPAAAEQSSLPLQRLRCRQALLHQREDPLPLRRQAHAGAVPDQHREAQFLFQGVHHMGQARLSIAQELRRPGKAALMHRRGQGLQLFRIHPLTSFPRS